MDGNGTASEGRDRQHPPRIAEVGIYGADPRLQRCIGLGTRTTAEYEAIVEGFARHGWRITSVSGGPPTNRNAWVDIERTRGAFTDGRNADGTPIQRYAYRLVGRERDLVDRGEEATIAALLADGWRLVRVLNVAPWDTRPLSFLEKPADAPIEIEQLEDTGEAFASERSITPEQAMAAIARALRERNAAGGR